MHESEEINKIPKDLTEFWQAWFDMTPEVWKNMAGIAADYFQNYTSFANSLQYTNQEYLRQMQLRWLTSQEATTERPAGGSVGTASPSRCTSHAHTDDHQSDDHPLCGSAWGLESYPSRSHPGGQVPVWVTHCSRLPGGCAHLWRCSATILPCPGTIYMGQTLKFLAPVRIGDDITASVEVIAIHEAKRILTLRTECTNQHGTLVLSGEAFVIYAQSRSRRGHRLRSKKLARIGPILPNLY